MLTIITYGTWFYGFGVLFNDLGQQHDVSATALGITFGIADLIAGIGAVIAGRRLDQFGPRAVLGVVGPLGAMTYAASSFASGTSFLAMYAIGGGLIGAAGFYSLTQPLSVRVVNNDPTRAITRLTIWGAFSSPTMIPFTEFLRANFGWQTAIRVPALLTLIAFLVCASVCRVDPIARGKSQSLVATLRTALINRQLRLFATAAFLWSLAMSTLLVFQVPTMIWAGVSTGVAAFIASSRGLLQLGGRLPLVAAINRFGAPRLMIIVQIALGVAPLLLLCSQIWIFAVLYIVIAGVAIGALSALNGVVARTVIQPENFGTITGGVALIATVGGALGPVFAGILHDQFDSPLTTMVSVTIAAWLAGWTLISARITRE